MICCLAWIVINCRGIHGYTLIRWLPWSQSAVSKSIVPNKLSKLWVSNPKELLETLKKMKRDWENWSLFQSCFLFGSYYFNSAYFRGEAPNHHRHIIYLYIFYMSSHRKEAGEGQTHQHNGNTSRTVSSFTDRFFLECYLGTDGNGWLPFDIHWWESRLMISMDRKGFIICYHHVTLW